MHLGVAVLGFAAFLGFSLDFSLRVAVVLEVV